jgi:hypothetical protein
VVMLRFCATFNVLVGAITTIFSVGLGLLAIGFAGGWSTSIEDFLEVLVVCGPLCFSGILYALSGVVLWKSFPAVTGKAIYLQGIAWILCLVYCLIWFIRLKGKFGVGGQDREPSDPFDEELVMFVFIPTAALFLVAIQLTYLWKQWRQQSS